MLQSDWPRQHSGAVHGMRAIVTRPSFPDGLARETGLCSGLLSQSGSLSLTTAGRLEMNRRQVTLFNFADSFVTMFSYY